MLILRGAPALSTFRTQKLLASLQQQVPAVAGIATEYVHFADLAAPLNEEEQSILRQLLTYGPKVDGEVSHDGQLFLAVPRPGTQSLALKFSGRYGIAPAQGV